jgi:hypothetical protein
MALCLSSDDDNTFKLTHFSKSKFPEFFQFDFLLYFLNRKNACGMTRAHRGAVILADANAS